jgi:hypothetical protein
VVLREAETPAAALISTPQLECDLNTTQQAATALFRLSSELAQPQKNGAGHKSQPCMEQEPVPTTSNSQQRRTLRSRGRRSSSRRSVSGGGNGISNAASRKISLASKKKSLDRPVGARGKFVKRAKFTAAKKKVESEIDIRECPYGF